MAHLLPRKAATGNGNIFHGIGQLAVIPNVGRHSDKIGDYGNRQNHRPQYCRRVPFSPFDHYHHCDNTTATAK
jgi:hypothetical protein